MKYGIGIDVGIASVGYAVLGLNEKDKPIGIIRMGVRTFEKAENPKDGASLALPRREARGARRRLRRHRHRLERIKNLVIDTGLVSAEELLHLFDGQLSDIYELRTRALDQLVSNKELVRICIHLAQRRGFKSNRKADTNDKETGKLLIAVKENAERLTVKGYRTVGEMFWHDDAFKECKRNKGGNYQNTVLRSMIEDEARLILKTQYELGNPLVSNVFIEKYCDILLSQRPFATLKNVGFCTLLGKEGGERAPKACYSFEYFRLLQEVNHIRIIHGSESLPLTAEQRKITIELAHKSFAPTFATIRKKIGIPEDARFNCVSYRDADKNDAEKKKKLTCLKTYHDIRKAMDKIEKCHIEKLNRSQLNAIGYAATTLFEETKIEAYLKNAGLNDNEIQAAQSLGNLSGYGHLCLTVCDKLIPHLEEGLTYSSACSAAGINFKSHDNNVRHKLLPAQLSEEDEAKITSPVVRRAISQTIKVINAIIREQGEQPTYINIETARELHKSFDDRRNIEKEILENTARNERIMERIKTEFGHNNPTGQDLLKLKLYEEQDGRCLYSGKVIPIENLFMPGYAEIDHIIPYSVSFDDSFCNKALVLTAENRDKGNHLPLQYLNGEKREQFIVRVNTSVRDYRKKQKLLKETITEDEKHKFRERNLQDTKMMSRFLYNYIADNLEFAPSNQGKKKRVTAVNGIITSYLRKRWGISKQRENGDLHHAVDALVIACTTDKLIHDITRYSVLRECEYMVDANGSHMVDLRTGEIKRTFPYPWEGFRRELSARISEDPASELETERLPFYTVLDPKYVKPIFISRMPNHKVTGAAHKDTIRSSKAIDQGISVVKTPLTSLKLNKDGEIENYYEPAKMSDRLLYDALKAQLVKFNNNAKKAFAEHFYKPKSDGTLGNIVKKVQTYEKTTLNVSVHNQSAIADNGSMVRVDVFFVEGDGYYLVPIYVSDTVKKELPFKAIIAGKPYNCWKEMKTEDFIFSLYPGDLVMVTHKKGVELTVANKESTLPHTKLVKQELLYYAKTSISTGSITLYNHDHTYMINSLGVKTLENLEKYQVDLLGNCAKVGKEKRQKFK